MKIFSAFLFSIALVGSLQAEQVPTPDMALSFSLNKDPRKWTQAFTDGGQSFVITELVPQGDSIDSWKEMVAQQIAFTKVSLREHVDGWKSMLVRADSKIEIKEEKNDDGSITVTYTSVAADEMSVRRFIKGSDGIYTLAYHVRPKLKNEERLKIWRGIISSASLVPNPLKKKANTALEPR